MRIRAPPEPLMVAFRGREGCASLREGYATLREGCESFAERKATITSESDDEFALQVYWNCMTVFETVGRGSIPRRGTELSWRKPRLGLMEDGILVAEIALPLTFVSPSQRLRWKPSEMIDL